MTLQIDRLGSGGRIDRTKRLNFTFDGKSYVGYQGDTLASALLANGVRLVGRSFKYHRRRGVYSAGPEEPNALVQLRKGERTEPNTRATMIELFEGLIATSQNRWPSLAFDLQSINQWFASVIPAGFYYKTFMWPAKFWMLYEKVIRHAAGLGHAPKVKDPDHYAYEYAHCDVLVVGSGPAGLAAARKLAETGLQVVLADERAELGGSCLWTRHSIDGVAASDWAQSQIAALAERPNVRLLARSTVFGCYDHGLLTIAERVTDHLATPPSHLPRQRLIHLRTKKVILASGTIERPLVFADNDKPGVMLANALQIYIKQYATIPGRSVVVFTNNDSAYQAAFAAAEAGLKDVTMIDSRQSVSNLLAEECRQKGIVIKTDHVVVAVAGQAVTSATIQRKDGGGPTETIGCDVLAHSGGWTPTVHLYSQAGGKLHFDETLSSFVPQHQLPNMRVVGAASGCFAVDEAIAQAQFVAQSIEREIKGHTLDTEQPSVDMNKGLYTDVLHTEPLWSIAPGQAKGKRFVDIQDDVCVEDIELAHRENFRSVEHLKRYTTLGMGTDQGKTSNVNGLAIMAQLRGESIPGVGTTTFRPPYTPVALGLLAGDEVGKHLAPVRRSPVHHWHESHGGVMATVGQWMRPKVYQQANESFEQAWRRESLAVRHGVGLVDVGTLGKIDVQGPDALTFLQRVYCNNFANLGVNKVRYGLMLRTDGIALDDGTVARLSDDHYLLTTTTANAAKIQSEFEYLLQVAWPELKCHAVSVTEQFAQFALAGPKSREVLSALLPEADVSDVGLGHLGILQVTLDGIAVNVMRMSYSGERAYEIAIGAHYGLALWARILEVGAPFGITPYGTEAMGVLRIEKGHVAGSELDGRTTPADLGLAKLTRKDGEFMGAALLTRSALVDPSRPRLMGFVPVDGRTTIRAGSHLVATESEARMAIVPHKQGFISCSTPSPFLGYPIALGFVENGASRIGQELVAASPLSNEFVRVRIVHPAFVDPDNTRLKG